MAAAEPVLALEALAEADIEDALGDDRVEGRALGSRSNGTERAAAELDGRGQPDVDEVACRQLADGASIPQPTGLLCGADAAIPARCIIRLHAR